MIDFQTLCDAKKVLLILKRSLFRIGSNQLSLFYLVGVLVMQQQSHRIMHLIEHFNVSGLNHFFAMQPTTVTTYDFLSWIMALIMFFFCSTSVCWHSGWKSEKKSHSTLRMKRATFTFGVDKSSLTMPKTVNFGEFLKTWKLKSNCVTRQVTFDRTKIGGKCQNPNATFWVIF